MTGGTEEKTGERELTEIEATVEHILFRNDVNGYTVAEVISDDVLMTANGIMPMIEPGDKVRLAGEWVIHPVYGEQFSVSFCEKRLPETEEDMIAYLSSGSVKGVGRKTAERIVGRFGTDTFDVIENHPEWLSDVKGVTKEKALSIAESFKENFEMRALMMFCRDYFGPAAAMRVYRKWGGAAVEMLKTDPYSLCGDDGISFDTAESIAADLGIPRSDPSRVRAGIVRCLKDASSSGHTFLPEDMLVKASAGYLGVGAGIVSDCLSELGSGGGIVRTEIEGRAVCFAPATYEAERGVADRLVRIDRECVSVQRQDIRPLIDRLEVSFDITYAAKQREAIEKAMLNGVMVLTGGPGTGKTTVIRAIIAVFELMGFGVALAAPTGRAANRLSEATSHEAKTVHRLLETDFAPTEDREQYFRRNARNPLDEDVIIVDEASMIDIMLADSLVKAVRNGGRIVFVGDADQLPSVGAGSLLGDIIRSGRFATVMLNEIFRQASESAIVCAAHDIIEGRVPELDRRDSDFFFMERKADPAAELICDLCEKRLPAAYGNLADGIQVICPTHNGKCGTANLNAMLQARLNPPEKGVGEMKYKSTVFRRGDRVMQVRNNYETEWEKGNEIGSGVFNGDIGKIVSVSPRERTLTVSFDGRITEYHDADLDDLELAYAITVHKSQGCEFPIVILPITDYFDRLYTRNLLYTAVTRAQNIVIITGSKDSLTAMIGNDRHAVRYTALSYFLKDETRD
ncbi:MAG: ATP-dependent RecD-like DNA helicase [Clostridia bacterium]|nr:ATP-dependent RecD-like DNA helicase [Clostridia bacterium]